MKRVFVYKNFVSAIKLLKNIKMMSVLFLVTMLGACATKTIVPADIAKLDQGNYSDLGDHFKALTIGQRVPTFTLPDADGKQVSLRNIDQKEAVLIVFYRGDWCPYCIDQLGSIAAVLPKIDALGVQVIAITPDPQISMQNTRRRFAQKFIFLSDPKASVIKKYGIARSNNLPHPSVYLVAKGGKLLWFYSSTNYKKRPNGKQLVEVIKSYLH